MPRTPQGTVRVRTLASGRTAYYARFRAPDAPGGPSKAQEVPLGKSPALNDDAARRALNHLMADVQRGIWTKTTHRESRAVSTANTLDPLMEEVISDWVAAVQAEWAPATRNDYMWQVSQLLLPYWGGRPVSEVSASEVRTWVRWLQGEELLDTRGRVKTKGFRKKNGDPLSPSSINAALNRLSSVLDLAVEDERYSISVSPFQQASFAVKDHAARARKHDFLDVDGLHDLLAAAHKLDAHKHPSFANLGRPALLAALFLGGLRVSEACALRWKDINLKTGTIRVGTHDDVKTAASVRVVNIVPGLRAELEDWRARTPYGKPSDFVFPTKSGAKRDRNNVRNRILHPTLRAANAAREAANENLPEHEHLSPLVVRGTHTGRRTYATHMLAIGEPSGYVQDQLGHASVQMTLGLYRQSSSSRAQTDKRLFDLYALKTADEPS